MAQESPRGDGIDHVTPIDPDTPEVLEAYCAILRDATAAAFKEDRGQSDGRAFAVDPSNVDAEYAQALNAATQGAVYAYALFRRGIQLRRSSLH